MPESPWVSFLPILRCPGLPYRKYGCAGASRLGKKSSPRYGARFPYFAAAACHTQSMAVPGRRPFFYRAARLSKKPVIASQCAHWRGNPFLKRTNPALFAGFCLKRYGFPRRFAPRSKCPWGTPRNDRGEVYRHAARPVFTGRFSVAILPEVWYNRTNVGRQVCLCGYWASIPASPLWASG